MATVSEEPEKGTRYPTGPLCTAWRSKLKRAQKIKDELFGNDAKEAMYFYTCSKELNDVMWGGGKGNGNFYADEGEALPAPTFRVIVGKTSEIVQLFGPTLYHKNPTNVVEPKTLDMDPNLLMGLLPPEVVQQAVQAAAAQGQQFTPQSLFPPNPDDAKNKVVAKLVAWILNYMQQENDKKTHMRRMIDEALIKGGGICVTEMYQPYKDGPRRIGSFYKSIDELLIDPDAESWDEVQWCALKYTEPVWEVADKYDLSENFLMKKYGSTESVNQQEDIKQRHDGKDKRKKGITNDLIEYWVIYSKMGMGHRLAGLRTQSNPDGLLDKETNEYLDKFGQNCMIVVADKVPYPLNLHPKRMRKGMEEDEKDSQKGGSWDTKNLMSTSWPIPFWMDGDWPFTLLAFHEVPNQVWPHSHVKPGLGYLKVMTWVMSFLVNRIRHSCRTVITHPGAMDEPTVEKLTSGRDFERVPIPKMLLDAAGGDYNKLIGALQMPEVNGEIWKVVQACSEGFERATGLTELAYGISGGMRSAQEAQIKEGNRSVRPEDMASKVEDCSSMLSRKEAMAYRWLFDEEDVEPIVGEQNAKLWGQLVMTKDFNVISREYNYRIEAGSTRKPNKDTQVTQVNAAIQAWMPFVTMAYQSGDPQPANYLFEKWGEANNFEFPRGFFKGPPPPPPNPMAEKAQAEIQIKREEHELSKQEMAAKIQMEREKNAMELQAKQAKTQADIQAAQAKMQIQKAEAENKLQLGQMEMQGNMAMQQQEMQLKQHQMQQEAQIADQQAKQQMALGQQKQQHEMQLGTQKANTEMALGNQKARNEMALGQQQAHSQMKIGEQAAAAKIRQGDMATKAKVQQAKQVQAAKPKPSAKAKPKGKGKKK